MKRIAFAIAWIVMLASCHKSNEMNYRDVASLDANKLVVLFQSEFINFAFGYQHNGWLISREGKVLRYKNPTKWQFPESDNTIKIEDMESNMLRCQPTSIVLSKNELNSKLQLLFTIDITNLSKPEQVASDAGALTYSFFTINKDGLYKTYLLSQSGDRVSKNQSPGAKELIDWLTSIDRKVAKE